MPGVLVQVAVLGKKEWARRKGGARLNREEVDRLGDPGTFGQKRGSGVQTSGKVQRVGLHRLLPLLTQWPVVARARQRLSMRLGPGHGARSLAHRAGRQVADTSEGEPLKIRAPPDSVVDRRIEARGAGWADRLEVSPQALQSPGVLVGRHVDGLERWQGQREAGERPAPEAGYTVSRGGGGEMPRLFVPAPTGLAQVVVGVRQALVAPAPDGDLVTAVALHLVVAQIVQGLPPKVRVTALPGGTRCCKVIPPREWLARLALLR